MHLNEKVKIGKLNSNDGMKGRSREHPPQFTPPYFSLWAFLNAGGLQVEDTRTKEQFTEIIMWPGIMWRDF